MDNDEVEPTPDRPPPPLQLCTKPAGRRSLSYLELMLSIEY